MSENTSGPQASDLPDTHTVSTDDLANYPVGTMIRMDDEVLGLYKRTQVADGVRVWLLRTTFDAMHGQAGPMAFDIDRADCAEPLWEVFTRQA